MPHALTAEEARAFDRRAIDELGVPGVVLMENAGRGAAEWLRSLGLRGRTVICCGKGNNGGDGLVIARHLAVHGHAAAIHLFADPHQLHGDAACNFTIARRLGLPIHVHAAAPLSEVAIRPALDEAEWIVDALFGTGLRGPIGPPFDAVIGWINASPAKVLAVDVPSGLDADSGEPLGPTVQADHTVTFAAAKRGFLNPAAAAWTGRVHVAHIGVPLVRP